MNKNKISLILGIMCLLLTLGTVIQIKTVSGTGTTISTNAKENELRDSVLKAKEKYDNLYEELERMENQLETERANSTQNNTELTKLENTIKHGNKILGLSEVIGNGLIITVDDSNKISLNDWIGDPNDLIVHDTDLSIIVNELKNVGAEAISINGQRIVNVSAIECDGNVIKINGEKMAAPFEIKAIGLPELLIGITRWGGTIDYMEKYRFLNIKVEKSDKEKLIIPKYTGVMKFEYAESK